MTTTQDISLQPLACTPVGEPDLTWTPSEPRAGEPITFTATATGTEPVEFAWEFGDGGAGDGAVVMHAYERDGTYTVVLTATNLCGAESISREVAVRPDRYRVYLPIIRK
jgi:PKD repeat protein